MAAGAVASRSAIASTRTVLAVASLPVIESTTFTQITDVGLVIVVAQVVSAGVTAVIEHAGLNA